MLTAVESEPNPAPVGRNDTARVTLYFSLLFTAWSFTPPGGIVGISTNFYLKDVLRESPQSLAYFLFILGLPVTATILFGFARDRWKPRKLGDRAFLLIGTAPTVVLGLWAASGPFTYGRLLVLFTVMGFTGQIAGVAIVALMADTGRRKQMTGWIGALWAVQFGLFGALVPFLGGLLGPRLREALLIGSAAAALVFAIGFWRSAAVFGNSANSTPQPVQIESILSSLSRLIRHRPLWPAAAMVFVWFSTPAGGTPFLFYLTSVRSVSNEVYGSVLAVMSLGHIPTSILYAPLSRRISVRPLLMVATTLAVVQWVPALFIHSAGQALVAAAIIGLLGGFANSAYLDLFIRCCPKALEGTGMTIGNTMFNLGGSAGNVVGAWIFARSGYVMCVLATTTAYTLLFPLLLLVPMAVMERRENDRGDWLASEPLEHVAI